MTWLQMRARVRARHVPIQDLKGHKQANDGPGNGAFDTAFPCGVTQFESAVFSNESENDFPSLHH